MMARPLPHAAALHRPASASRQPPGQTDDVADDGSSEGEQEASPAKRWTRWLGIIFAIAVVGLLAWAARRVDWQAVLVALRSMPLDVVAAAAGVSALSYLLYASYDLIGRAWIGHKLAWWRVLGVTAVSYAFNLNLGKLVGGLGIRYRLYARLGLRGGQIGRVLTMSIFTNWLGYGVLAGGVFLFRLLPVPADWHVSGLALQGLGAALWLLVGGYLALCGWSTRRSFTVRKHTVQLPSLGMASVQIVLSCANWLAISVVLYLLFRGAVPYGVVLGTSLVAAVAGVVARLPAGLGVVEAVFVTVLASRLPEATVLAAVLVYRALYYLLPLLLATGGYLLIEAKAPRAPAKAGPAG